MKNLFLNDINISNLIVTLKEEILIPLGNSVSLLLVGSGKQVFL